MNYFVLKVTGGDEDAVIDALPKGSPPEWKFHEGVELASEFPADAALRYSDNFPDARRLRDFVPNILSLLIVSPEVLKIFDEAGVRSAEFLKVRICDHRGAVAGEDFAIVNLLGAQPAIDMDRSDVRMSRLAKGQIADINTLVLDRASIAEDAVLFRATTYRRLYLAREDLVEKLRAAGVEGFKAFEADGWDGLDF